MPLTVLSFDAVRNNGVVALSWSVSDETNIKDYVVERAGGSNGVFTAVQTVTAKGSHSSGGLRYQTLDEHPANGINHYRLKSIGKDGKEELSRVASVSFAGYDRLTLSGFFHNS